MFDLEKDSLQSSKCIEGEYTFITAVEEWKTHNEYSFIFNVLKDEIIKNTKSRTSKESINQSNLRNYEIPYFEIDKLVNTKSIKEDLELELSI